MNRQLLADTQGEACIFPLSRMRGTSVFEKKILNCLEQPVLYGRKPTHIFHERAQGPIHIYPDVFPASIPSVILSGSEGLEEI